MKKVFIVMVLLALTRISTAFAGDAPPPGQAGGPGQNFDKMKSDVVSRITARIARNQEELTCVQAAKNHDDLKACRHKFMEEMKEQRGQRH